MTKRVFGVFALATLVGAVAVPLSAQSVRLTANIPFEFSAGRKTLPAGEYEVLSASEPDIVQVRTVQPKASVLVVTGSADSGERSRAGAPMLVFNRYGDQYFLFQIWDGSQIGRELPKTRNERELAKTASAKRTEIVAMLMPR